MSVNSINFVDVAPAKGTLPDSRNTLLIVGVMKCR